MIMYVMLCGYPPFYGDTDAEVLAKVRLGSFSFNAQDWRKVSEDAKDLIKGLLKMNPPDRLTAEKAISHIWIEHKAPKASSEPLNEGLVYNLRGFARAEHKLKKAALHIIANQLNQEQIKTLKATFEALDANHDGTLSVKEISDGLKKANLKNLGDIDRIIEEIDADGSGVVDYTEFLAAALDKKTYTQEEVCWAAFRVFDLDGDGKISKAELEQVLQDGMVCEEMGEMIKAVDKNGDGEIDFDEFMEMMRSA